MSVEARDGDQRPRIVGSRTSRTLRAHWALLHLALAARQSAPDLRRPGRYQAVNAAGKVPTLEDGALTVSKARPSSPISAKPTTAIKRSTYARRPRGRVIEWMSFITMELTPPRSTCCAATACPRFTATRHKSTRYAGIFHAYGVGRRRPPARPAASPAVGRQFKGVDILMMTLWNGRSSLSNLLPRLAAYRDTVAAMPIYQKAAR